MILILLTTGISAADEPPLSAEERREIRKTFESRLKRLSTDEGKSSTAIHSQRGDALFFLGRFDDAVKEYEAMVTLDPKLDASHWRLGIALFFADRPEQAAAQFDKYHSYDNVDRENGIWRYLSHYKARGAAAAKKELLKYEKDDREPFPMVYRLFDDSVTPAEALKAIPADLAEAERDKRLFYTQLYIGMHMVVKDRKAEAVRYLKMSTARTWPRTAGFGPNYMWHVGRVQLNELAAASRE